MGPPASLTAWMSVWTSRPNPPHPMITMGLVYVVASPLLDPTNRLLLKIVAAVLIGLSFVTGSFGNRLYRARATRIATESAEPGQAAARGGVSLAAAIGCVVGLTLLSVLAGMIPALLGHG